MNKSTRVLWLQVQPEHYFNCMIDALNAASDYEWIAGFMYKGPGWYKEVALPQHSRSVILRPLPGKENAAIQTRQRYHADWRADLYPLDYHGAIVSGYAWEPSREFMRDCRRRGIPVAMFSDSNLRSQHGRSLKKRLWRGMKKLAMRPIIRGVDHLLTANNLGVAYWRYYGAPRAKIERCAYFADYDRVARARQTQRGEVFSRAGLDPAGRYLITAARLVPQKGLHLLFNAFRNSNLAAEGWRLLHAGTGPLEAEMEALCGAALGKSIFLLGFVEPSHLLPLIHHCDLFVLPSLLEPHGIVVHEAMAADTPVLASYACGAAHDLVKHGRTGWIFRTGDQADLERQLSAICGDPAGLAAMRPVARAAFERWHRQTNPVVVADRAMHALLEKRS